MCRVDVFPCYSFYLDRLTGKVKAGSQSGSVGIMYVGKREGVLIEFTKQLSTAGVPKQRFTTFTSYEVCCPYLPGRITRSNSFVVLQNKNLYATKLTVPTHFDLEDGGTMHLQNPEPHGLKTDKLNQK